MEPYRINLLVKNKDPQKTDIKLCSGDYGIPFDIRVKDYDTTGTTAQIVFHRPDGQVVESPLEGSDGVYTYEIMGNELEKPGIVVADVKFSKTGSRDSTAKFVFTVDSDTLNDTPLSSGAYSASLDAAIDEALAAAEEAREAAEIAVGGSGDMSRYVYDPDHKGLNIYEHDTKDDTITFTQAATLANVESTEKHSVLFGKIMKWFSFIGTTALTTTATTITTAINELKSAIDGKLSKSNLSTATTGQVLTRNSDGTASFQTPTGGSGSGDMLKSVYDSTNKDQDIFAYADTKVAKANVVNNGVTTATDTVLDGRMGKTLQDQITLLGFKKVETISRNLTVATANVGVSLTFSYANAVAAFACAINTTGSNDNFMAMISLDILSATQLRIRLNANYAQPYVVSVVVFSN